MTNNSLRKLTAKQIRDEMDMLSYEIEQNEDEYLRLERELEKRGLKISP